MRPRFASVQVEAAAVGMVWLLTVGAQVWRRCEHGRPPSRPAAQTAQMQGWSEAQAPPGRRQGGPVGHAADLRRCRAYPLRDMGTGAQLRDRRELALDQATQAALALLPDIGEKRAAAIWRALRRRTIGPDFRLQFLPDIGERRAAALRPWLCLSAATGRPG
ncbi:MAG: hypothetical protein ACPGUV_04575 [Polyangiales bacterium]